MDFNKPFMGASKILIDRLGKNYMMTQNNITRANYVHLVCVSLMKDTPGKSYQFYVRTAIERLNIDMEFKHHDPYELWIDAGFFDAELNELNES